MLDVGNVHPEKSELSRRNYKGLVIAIENEVDSVREGTNKQGVPWKTRFYYPYGFIVGTRGSDGDEVDCYLGDAPESDMVYIIHQLRPDGGYDEDKVMLAFRDLNSARDAYLAHIDTQGFIGRITEMPLYEFKKKIMQEGKQGLRIS